MERDDVLRPAEKPEKPGRPPANPVSETQQQPRKSACAACRKRKIRCDGNKPMCGTCARLDKICSYPEVGMKASTFINVSSKAQIGGTPQRPKKLDAHPSKSPKPKTASRPSHVNLKLQEWIDGNTVHSTAQIASDVGFAEIYFRTCLASLQRIWGDVLRYPNVFTYREKKGLKESLSRLILWMDGFESGVLDRILDRAEDLRESVLQLINEIGKSLACTLLPLTLKIADDQLALAEHYGRESVILTKDELQRDIRNINSLNENFKLVSFNGATQDESDIFTSDDDSETALNSTTSSIFDISSASRRLMDLLPSLEKSAAAIHNRRAENATLLPVPFKVSGPASYFISHVMDKFREADINLAERLGEANWQRHERIRRQIEMVVNGYELLAPGDDVVANSVFKPFSMFHDSGIGSSRPAESSYAISNASHSSFLTTLTQKGSGSFRVPELPEGATYGEPFKCEICGHVLSKIKNRVDWKRHVFADLQPYICTWGDCRDELTTFPTRQLWGNHEVENHRTKSTWRCYECSADLGSPDDLKAHLRSIHQNRFSDSQLAIATSTAKISHPMSVKDMKCPLCLGHAGDSRKAFENHVGKHMEEIALASLPRNADEDLDTQPEESGVEISSMASADLRPKDIPLTEDENMQINQMASELARTTPKAEMLQRQAIETSDDVTLLEGSGVGNTQVTLQENVRMVEQATHANGVLPPLSNPPLSPSLQQRISLQGDQPTWEPSLPEINRARISLPQHAQAWTDDMIRQFLVRAREHVGAREHEDKKLQQYNAVPAPDGKYRCPYANQKDCDHEPTLLKSVYDKYLDTHLMPHRCSAPQCAGLRFSSSAVRLRHEREAHSSHGRGKKSYLCQYPGCDRAKPYDGFPRRWNLYDHMKRVHKWTAPEDEAQVEDAANERALPGNRGKDLMPLDRPVSRDPLQSTYQNPRSPRREPPRGSSARKIDWSPFKSGPVYDPNREESTPAHSHEHTHEAPTIDPSLLTVPYVSKRDDFFSLPTDERQLNLQDFVLSSRGDDPVLFPRFQGHDKA